MGKSITLAEALDYAIKASKNLVGGYIIDGKTYNNYYSNEEWDEFKKKIKKSHINQFENASGGEIKERKGRWGTYPPKMASFGSSSRELYELSKDIEGFIFEKQLDTNVGGVANLDGYINRGETQVFVEAKCREIYYSPHVNQKIKEVYKKVCDHLKSSTNLKYSLSDKKKETGFIFVTFEYKSKVIQFFDMKQILCHFLGIAHGFKTGKITGKHIKFLYFIYNPYQLCQECFVKDKRDKILERYDTVKEEIKSIDFNNLFQEILSFQYEEASIPDVTLEFKLVDQSTFQSLICSDRL